MIKAKLFCLIVFISLLFTSCLEMKDVGADVVYIENGGGLNTSLQRPKTIFLTAAYRGQGEVSSAKIFIGNTVEVTPTQSPQDIDPFVRFEWITNNSCQDLPQGKNITVRQEMYDQTGNVLQKDQIVIDIETC